MHDVKLSTMAQLFLDNIPEETAEQLSPLKFTWGTTPALSDYLTNRGHTFADFTEQEHLRQKANSEECTICAHFPNLYKLPMADGQRHVCTTDMSLLLWAGPCCARLHNRLPHLSLAHHPPLSMHPSDCERSVRRDLVTAVNRFPRHTVNDDFEPAICAVLKYVEQCVRHPSKSARDAISKCAKHAVRETDLHGSQAELKGVVEVLSLDKTLTTALLMCVLAAREEVIHHLRFSGQFAELKCPSHIAVASLKVMVTTHMPAVVAASLSNRLGYAFLSKKAHKGMQTRFLTAMPCAPTQPLSVLAVKICNALFERMRCKCATIENIVYATHGYRIKLVFDIKNIADVTMNMCGKTFPSLSKWDVKGCFPALPLTDPEAGLLCAFEQFTKWACDSDLLWVHTSRDIITWHEPDIAVSHNYVAYNQSGITSMLSDLAMKATSACGDIIVRKIVGIPEGYEASPPMSSIYLTWWPLKAMLSMLERGEIQLVASLANTFRCADDILSLGCPGFPRLLHILWPTRLIELQNETNDPIPGQQCGRSAEYLSASFWLDDSNTLHCRPYSKLIALQIPHYRHEHICSNMPPQMVYSILTGTLVLMAFSSSSAQHFQDAVDSHFFHLASYCGLKQNRMQALLRQFWSVANKRWKLPFVQPGV